jgi:hypothetical protein
LTGPIRPTVNPTIGAISVASNPFDVSSVVRLSGDGGYGVPFTTHEMLLTFPFESLPRLIVRVYPPGIAVLDRGEPRGVAHLLLLGNIIGLPV